MTEKPTLAEIAREANVAVSTVSKVLNRHTDVSAGTRRRIEQLLSDRGYRRPATARRTGRHADLIDLVLGDLSNGWSLAVLGGIEEVTEEAGFRLVVSAAGAPGTPERGSAGAILVLAEVEHPQFVDLDRWNVPFVVVDGFGRQSPAVPSIGATDFAGGYAATEHLVRLGHRRIGVIGGPEQLQCTRARIAGYRAALESSGLGTDRELVHYGDFRHAGGLSAAAAMLALPERPTAIFAGNDELATGVYEAARRAGLRIPGDVSVVGFDDLPFARFAAPPLTTVRQPLHEMGAAAARTLLRLVNGERLESTRVELATGLIVRGSTASVV